MQHNPSKCPNSGCLLHNKCTHKGHVELIENKTYTFYKKGQNILQEGQIVKGMYFIQTGRIKIYKESDYRTQIVRLSQDGDILGHRGLGGEDKYPISAETLVDSFICYIDNKLLFNLMLTDSKLAIKIMLFYADELKATELRFYHMAIMTVQERIADALLWIQNKFNLSGEQDNIDPIHLSRKEIAEIAGTYPEQVSRFLNEFKNQGLLELNGKSIIIEDKDGLDKIIAKYKTVNN